VMAAGTRAARGRHGGAGTRPSGAPPVLLVPRARLLDPPPSRPSSATPPRPSPPRPAPWHWHPAARRAPLFVPVPPLGARPSGARGRETRERNGDGRCPFLRRASRHKGGGRARLLLPPTDVRALC
jgi:hypothetical protein